MSWEVYKNIYVMSGDTIASAIPIPESPTISPVTYPDQISRYFAIVEVSAYKLQLEKEYLEYKYRSKNPKNRLQIIMPDPSREENFFTATSLALLATTSASGAGVHSMFLKNEQFSLISKPKWGGALNIHVVENEKDIKELADNKIYIRAQENFLKEDKKKKDEPEPMPEPLSSNNRLFVPQRFVSLTEINPAKGSLSVGRGQRSWMKKEENQGKDHWQANRNRKARQNDHEAGEHGIS